MEDPSEYSYYSEESKDREVTASNLHAALGVNATKVAETRFRQDVIELYERYRAINDQATVKTKHKYGLLQRIGLSPEYFSSLSREL